MRTRYRLLIVLAGVVVVAGMFVQLIMHTEPSGSERVKTPVNVETLYTASFPDAQDKLQPLSQWRNQVVVVNFWASWCPPCRDEMPELSALQDKYRNRGLVVLGLSTDDANTLRATQKESPQSYHLLAAGDAGMDLAIGLGDQEEVLPFTLVLAKDGSIAASYWGRLNMQALEQSLLPLLH